MRPQSRRTEQLATKWGPSRRHGPPGSQTFLPVKEQEEEKVRAKGKVTSREEQPDILPEVSVVALESGIWVQLEERQVVISVLFHLLQADGITAIWSPRERETAEGLSRCTGPVKAAGTPGRRPRPFPPSVHAPGRGCSRSGSLGGGSPGGLTKASAHCFRAVGSVLGSEHQPCSEAVCPDDRTHLSSERWLRDVVRRGREGTHLSALTAACLPPLLCLAAPPLHPVTWDLGFRRKATPWAWSLLP